MLGEAIYVNTYYKGSISFRFGNAINIAEDKKTKITHLLIENQAFQIDLETAKKLQQEFYKIRVLLDDPEIPKFGACKCGEVGYMSGICRQNGKDHSLEICKVVNKHVKIHIHTEECYFNDYGMRMSVPQCGYL